MNHCEGCPIGLFNQKSKNLSGVGNAWSGRCIVVPNVDLTAYKKGGMEFSEQVNIIKDALSFFTGDLLNDVYILPLIRCSETIACPLDSNSFTRCFYYFMDDVKTFGFKDIMLMGESAKRIMGNSVLSYLDTIFISGNHRFFINYSPLIKYTDEVKFDVFKNNLSKWFIASTNYSYGEYKQKLL